MIRIASAARYCQFFLEESPLFRRVGSDAQKLSGDFIEEAIPDPISNSEVKLFGADGTAWGICVGE
jgi:hypothetical protein